MNRKSMSLAGFLAVAALTLGLAVPANADDEPTIDVGAALFEVTSDSSSPATDVLSDVADVATDAVGETAIDATVAGIDVTIPTDPSDAITLESSSGDVISIEMPFAEAASDATVVTEGVVAYDNNNASSTAPVVKDDGSLQVTTVIESGDAPSEYSYELSFPDGAVASLGEDGSVTVLNSDGIFVAGVAPAWATDANGASVPTHYVLNGSTLTQVVEHNGADVVYPVVADPWLGINLFDRMATSSEQGQPRYMLYRSAWGAAMSVGGSGTSIFLWAGWSEATTRWPVLYSKLTLRQQYECHAVWALYKPDSWNLEKFRANKSDWAATALTHKCNW